MMMALVVERCHIFLLFALLLLDVMHQRIGRNDGQTASPSRRAKVTLISHALLLYRGDATSVAIILNSNAAAVIVIILCCNT